MTICASTAHNITKVVVFHVAQNSGTTSQRHSLQQGRHGQIPELDMAIAHSHKIWAVLRECDALDFTSHFVGGYFKLGAAIPNVDDHVMHGAYRDQETWVGCWWKGNAFDGELMPAEFTQLDFFAYIPYSDFRIMSTLTSNKNCIY